jgi:hypothetical protein
MSDILSLRTQIINTTLRHDNVFLFYRGLHARIMNDKITSRYDGIKEKFGDGRHGQTGYSTPAN